MPKNFKNKKDSLPVIIFLGPQGSGKGTQARLIVEKYGFHLLEMGGMLRDNIARKTSLGRQAKKYLEHGKLVPSWMPEELLKQGVKKFINGKIVIDGAPRQIGEARAHERNINKLGRKISIVFYITLSNTEAMKRLMLRGRADDTPEKIRTRLAWSRAKLKGIVKYFKKSGYPVVSINGEQTVVQVHKDIIKVLKKHRVINL